MSPTKWLETDTVLARGAHWFRGSGIQESSGGVARYYRSDLGKNHRISTEITGYAVSSFLFLGRPAEAAAAAHFLTGQALKGGAMPFELEPAEHSYFFDCGIIARGLVAAWRATGEQDFLDIASAVGNGMLADFAAADGSYYPVIRLPKKEPIPRDPLRWSQSPGCYQLKAALGWYELFEATGETGFLHAYYGLCESALREYGTFLPGHSDPAKIVDRLHAFLYFLEGLLPRAEESSARAALGEGIRQVAAYADELRPHLERSDVYAQLLRLRIFADGLGAVRLDRAAAQHEAVTLVEFQAESQDPRVDGGFYFGRKAGEFLPYISPVSTAFALQALALYCGDATPDWHQLV